MTKDRLSGTLAIRRRSHYRCTDRERTRKCDSHGTVQRDCTYRLSSHPQLARRWSEEGRDGRVSKARPQMDGEVAMRNLVHRSYALCLAVLVLASCTQETDVTPPTNVAVQALTSPFRIGCEAILGEGSGATLDSQNLYRDTNETPPKTISTPAPGSRSAEISLMPVTMKPVAPAATTVGTVAPPPAAKLQAGV